MPCQIHGKYTKCVCFNIPYYCVFLSLTGVAVFLGRTGFVGFFGSTGSGGGGVTTQLVVVVNTSPLRFGPSLFIVTLHKVTRVALVSQIS